MHGNHSAEDLDGSTGLQLADGGGAGALHVQAVSHRLANWGIAMFIVLAVYLIAVNVWFIVFVSMPLKRLTEHANRIAEGSYGVHLEEFDEDEIGYLAEAINGMSEKAAVAENNRTEFISQISHELRTPLTAITGWAETIAFDPAVQGDSLRGINIITKEAERLTNMVKELLEFTRIQDGRFNLRLELIDIAAELEDALFTYGELMRQSGMQVNYTAPENEIALIPGDPERLKQVFLNLLDNAAKHGGSGKCIQVFIDLSRDHDGSGRDYARIRLRDFGPGIPPDELPHIKLKFYKGSSKARGSGIGLAVCDEIVRRHGGTLEIENAEECGTVVTVLLPTAV